MVLLGSPHIGSLVLVDVTNDDALGEARRRQELLDVRAVRARCHRVHHRQVERWQHCASVRHRLPAVDLRRDGEQTWNRALAELPSVRGVANDAVLIDDHGGTC